VVLRLLSLTRPGALPERREPLFQFRISLRQGDRDANPARLLPARRERLQRRRAA
jgi:hypothetical protein